MCNLYRLDAPAAAMARLFAAAPGADPWAGDYVAPGKFAPVVVTGSSGRRIVPRLWGVPPPPRAVADGNARPVTNVRNLTSPFWVGTLRHREYRCLVPVTSFMEWGQAADPATGRKRQHWFALPSQPLFAFAGIWRDSAIPGGEDGVPSFAFLTTDANRLVGAVHPKAMPVILHPEDWEGWLTADWTDAAALVAPYPSQLMTVDALPASG